jgi:hypothetical protein
MKKKIFFVLTLILVVIFALWFFNHKTFCANSISCVKDLSGKYDSSQTSGEYMGKPVLVPDSLDSRLRDVPDGISLRGDDKDKILGKTTTPLKSKKILVNLTTQELFAYEDDELKYKFKISSGKFYPTPVGKFYIWTKLLATKMEGGEKENNTYYRLPSVPYTMFFYNKNVGKGKGYGIHGMYWYSDFGYPSTHGCIGLSVEDAEKLFYWTDPYPVDAATFAEGNSSTDRYPIY